MSRALAWTTAALALLALGGGCAAQRAAAERARLLQGQLDEVRYSRPLDEVWAEARRLLADRGYPLAGADAEAVGQKPWFLSGIFSPAKDTRPDPAGGQVLETGWGPGSPAALRYRLQGSAGGSGCRVVFWAVPEDQTEHGRDGRPPRRGLDMELDLARRLDPEAAARIEAALAQGPGG